MPNNSEIRDQLHIMISFNALRFVNEAHAVSVSFKTMYMVKTSSAERKL